LVLVVVAILVSLVAVGTVAAASVAMVTLFVALVVVALPLGAVAFETMGEPYSLGGFSYVASVTIVLAAVARVLVAMDSVEETGSSLV